MTSRLMRTAGQEAERARHGYIGCEHLLLALLADKDPAARNILAGHSIGLPAARIAVDDVVSSGHGDGPRWSPADLLATLGVDLPAIQRQLRAGFGPDAIDELYRSPVGRRLPWGPLCGPRTAPGLKKALFGSQRPERFADSGHALLSLLDADSAGLGAVLEAMGSSPIELRDAVSQRLRQAR
jgi:ATP-dependent Clp protease ATP-binding subunit ClpA